MARILLRGALLTAAGILGSANIAQAHFHLNAPENWLVQATNGTPQKTGPCGDPSESMPAAAMSNMVTEYKAGETIAVKLKETVTHPGHYRVALSLTGHDGLPAEPKVTKSTTDTSANGQCGTAEVMAPPVMPVLVDGALDHTDAFNGEQTIMVTLPADVECENCTLQVLEFMSDHSAPCFYHHCAEIKITKDGGMSAGGMGGMSAGGTSAGGMSAGGAAGMGVTAGSSGIGGATGQGGASGTTGVMAPAGAGGVSGTGGSATTMAGTGNTALGGTGNTTAGTAGGTVAHAGTGTTPSAPAAAKDETDSEGGCSMAAGRTSSPLALLALLGLASLRRRGVRQPRHARHRV